MAAACVGSVYTFHSWWVSPERRIAAFARALNRRDWDAMLALASEHEVAAMGLTPDNAESFFTGCAPYLRDGCRLAFLSALPFPPRQQSYNRFASYSLRDRRGTPARLPDGRQAEVTVKAYRAESGSVWRIGISVFARDLVRWSHPRGQRYAYCRACAAAGVRPWMLAVEEGEWHNLAGRPAQTGSGVPAARLSRLFGRP